MRLRKLLEVSLPARQPRHRYARMSSSLADMSLATLFRGVVLFAPRRSLRWARDKEAAMLRIAWATDVEEALLRVSVARLLRLGTIMLTPATLHYL